MTERGTTGAGRHQMAGVPRVHPFSEPEGRLDEIRRGQTRVGYNGVCLLKPPAMIHGSAVCDGRPFFRHFYHLSFVVLF